MGEGKARRFEVIVEAAPPRGDLYELELRTYYRVVDRSSGRVVLEYLSLTEASLSRDTGMWEDDRLTGVREVSVTPDGRSVAISYHDGRQELVPLPA